MKYVVNNSFKNKINKLDDSIDDYFRETLQEVADTAVNLSPVDTGAYVTSFSYIVGAGRPRGKSSEGKPRNQDVYQMREEGYQNLMSDVNRINFDTMSGSLTLSNGSPHATDVEYGGERWRKSPYGVFGQLEDRYG